MCVCVWFTKLVFRGLFCFRFVPAFGCVRVRLVSSLLRRSIISYVSGFGKCVCVLFGGEAYGGEARREGGRQMGGTGIGPPTSVWWQKWSGDGERERVH